jgi:hypothetical protein
VRNSLTSTFLIIAAKCGSIPPFVGAALVIIAIVVAIVCAIRCCCCSGDDDDDCHYAADFPDLYNMNTAPPLAYRGPSVAHNIDSLPIIHLPSALPKSGVLQGTERAALPTAIAVDPANPIPLRPASHRCRHHRRPT